MKTDDKTLELPGMPMPKKRGRPASGQAMTGAERIRKLREERKAKGICPYCGQPLPSAELV